MLTVESNARLESGARQRIRYAGFPAINTINDFDFTDVITASIKDNITFSVSVD